MNSNLTPRITVADVEATREKIRSNTKGDWSYVDWCLAGSLISHFMGLDWTQGNFLPNAPKGAKYLTLDFSSRETASRSIYRFLEFAETLFNLQHIVGFDDRIERMKTADPETSYAEFDIAKFLFLHGVPFKFVVPSGKRDTDYDFELIYPDGRVACAESKCRVESADIRPHALNNPLRKAVKQLPEDRPGIVFVTLPQKWFDNDDLSDEIKDAGLRFLQNVNRIVLIVFYASKYEFRNEMIWNPHRHAQLPNPNHKFDRDISWQLVIDATDYTHSPGWHRIFTVFKHDQAEA